jgi:hypothetical protein
MIFVLDASTALVWIFGDERAAATDAASPRATRSGG